MSELNKTILIKSFYSVQVEGKAAAAITPGMLVERTSAAVDTLQAQAAAAANCQKMVALEDDLQGNDIDDAYATGAPVKARIALPGDELLLVLATSQVIVKGDKLESAGAGLVRKLNAGTPLFVAREAVTTTTATGRIIGEAL